MAKRAGAYKSEKRKKEVKRQKKQEEKRLRRSGLLKPSGEGDNPDADSSGDAVGEQEEGAEGESGQDKAEETGA